MPTVGPVKVEAATPKSAPTRRWKVEVYLFDPHTVDAPTIGAARYATFKALQDAGYFGNARGSFHAFLCQGVSVNEVRHA